MRSTPLEFIALQIQFQHVAQYTNLRRQELKVVATHTHMGEALQAEGHHAHALTHTQYSLPRERCA